MSLTPFACSVHTHSTFCDGKNSMAEMAAAACEAGVRYYGFSGHGHTPCPADIGICMDADPSEYRAEAERLRKEYEGRMEILVGIEQDLCADIPVPDWAEYWIGSVHDLQDPNTGKYYAVDWKMEELEACRDEMCGGDGLALAEAYYAAVAEMAKKHPPILGHIDLITKLNGDGSLFDEDSPRYKAAALTALHAANPQTTVLEINTGAIARGYRTAPYPAPFLLKEWHAMGGRIILTADTHHTGGIQFAYADAAAHARGAGYRTAVILTRNGWVDVPL